MSGPRPPTRDRSSSWSPPERCTSTASGPLPSSPALPLPISLLPPFWEPTVPLVDNLLVLGAPLVGTLLMVTVLLALLGAYRFLGGFHHLANGLPGEHPHYRIHDDVAHAAHLPGPPPALGCLTWELPQGTSGPVLCLPSAVPGIVLYIHLFAPHVLLDDLPLVDDVFANADLLFHHWLFLDHDLVLDHRHRHLVGPYLGLRSLASDRHPLDAGLLATGRHLDALTVGADAFADVDATDLALAGPREQFFFAPLHPELVLVLEVASRLAEALQVAVVLAELACLGVAHAHPRADRAGAAVASVRPPTLRPNIPVVDACALSRLRNRLRFRPGLCVTAFLVCGVRGVLVFHGGSRYRAVFGLPGVLPVCHVHVGVFVVVGAVSAPASQWRLARRPEVRVDPLLELGGNLRVVAEAGTLFDGGFV